MSVNAGHFWLFAPVFRREQEEMILARCAEKASAAPNVFQWAVADGLRSAIGKPFHIVNALPVGIWPKSYRQLFLRDEDWQWDGAACKELGAVNLPFVKQWGRTRRALHFINRHLEDGDEVFLPCVYMPFLKALRLCRKKVKVTVTVTDLPEYADLNETGTIRRFLRKRHTEMTYRCLTRADRFVLLTEPMKQAVHAGDRPCLVMEGIYGGAFAEPRHIVKRVIFYSGTLFYRFGIGDLLKAFSLMPEEDLELWLCGSGEAEEEIRRKAEADPRIRFFGFCTQKQVAELRSQAAVLVNPRTDEGDYTKYSFPSKTMEYLASGIPTVMHPLSGMPGEYLEHIIPVRENTPEALSEALYTGLNLSAEERDLMGHRAAAFIRQNKTAEAQGARILAFLENNPQA